MNIHLKVEHVKKEARGLSIDCLFNFRNDIRQCDVGKDALHRGLGRDKNRFNRRLDVLPDRTVWIRLVVHPKQFVRLDDGDRLINLE